MSENNQTLAIKYRPKTFSEVVGQDQAVKLLKSVVKKAEVAPKAIFLEGPYGTGKCVGFDTRVATEKGYEKIGLMDPSPLHNPVHSVCEFVRSVQQENGTYELTSHFYKEVGDAELIKIKLSNGRIVNGTGKHKILVALHISSKRVVNDLQRMDEIEQGQWVVFKIGMPTGIKIEVSRAKAMDAYVLGKLYGTEEETHTIIPEWMFTKSQYERASFLLGLYSMIGVLKYDTPFIHFVTSHETLMLGIVELMESLGVISCVDGEIVGMCAARRCDLDLFREVLSFIGVDLGETDSYRLDTIKDFKDEICYLPGQVKEFKDSNYMAFTAEEFSYSKENVYDLTVPKTEVFRAQGTLNHNTTLARIFAKAFSCENFETTSEVCGTCEPCRKFDEGVVTDRYIEYDSADVGNVEDIKSLRSVFDQVSDHYRVITLDECHLMSPKAQSALLKVIEEGSSRTFYVLCTTDPEKVLKTIISRSLPVELSLIEHEVVIQRMKEVCIYEDIQVPSQEILGRIALKADGHMRDAMMTLSGYLLTNDEAVITLPIEEVKSFFAYIANRNIENARDKVSCIMKYPVHQVHRSLNYVIMKIIETSFLKEDNEYKYIADKLGKSSLQLFKIVSEPWVNQAFKDEYLAYAFFLTLLRMVTGNKK